MSDGDINKKYLFYKKPIDAIAKQLRADIDNGLSDKIALKRISKFGKNTVASRRGEIWKIFARQFKSVLVWILAISALISFFMGRGVEGLTIIIILILNALVGLYYEKKASGIADSLTNYINHTVTVLRGGDYNLVNSENLTVGDVVLLKSGDMVPADMKIITASDNLSVDESAISGESEPKKKWANYRYVDKGGDILDMPDVLLAGSFVVSGKVKGLVVSVGRNSFMGEVASYVEDTGETPLALKIGDISKKILIVSVGLVLCVFVAGLISGVPGKDIFLTAVSLMVSVVPESLPIMITLALALGAKRMLKKNVLVRNVYAGEGLSGVSLLALDKTGTITENSLAVSDVFFGGDFFGVERDKDGGTIFTDSSGKRLALKDMKELRDFGWICTLASNVDLAFDGDGKRAVIGDPTERAILGLGEKTGHRKENLLRKFKKLDEVPFSFKNKFYAGLYSLGGDERLAIVTGAPMELIKKSVSEYSEDTPIRKDLWEKRVKEMTGKGLRVIGVAVLPSFPGLSLGVSDIKNLTMVGLLGMSDPIRKSVPSFISEMNANDIKIVMITGDNLGTAKSIAEKAGLSCSGAGEVMSGADLLDMDDEELRNVLPSVKVIARSNPASKMRILKSYKESGYVVAMTGDGTNDAPALVGADVGIAMASGTDIAIKSADIVILDNVISHLSDAIKEARNIFVSISNIMIYLFSSNIGEALAILLGIIFTGATIMTPLQIIWINLATDGFLVFAMLLSSPGTKRRLGSFRGFGELLGKEKLLRIVVLGIFMAGLSLFLFMKYYGLYGYIYASTMAVTSIIFAQIWGMWSIRTDKMFYRENLFGNIYLLIASFVASGMQIFALKFEWSRELLNFAILSGGDLVLAVFLPALVLLVDSLFKKLYLGARF